jgi:poly(3-hydroxybutyrate) depolymerase
MLYQWYETQRAFMAPFSEFASASAKLYNHPLSPFVHTPMAQRISAGLDLMHRLAKDYEKPQFGISSATVGGIEVAVQQQTALEKPFCRLLRFKRFTDNPVALDQMKSQPTVLVVAPLSGHHSTLLRDTVRSLLHDHKVFITDWTDARMVPVDAGPFHLDDYVAYVQEFIRHVGPHAHVMSVCQPTVPVLAAVSLMASRGEPTPLTMTMMGGPIDARKSPTAVNNLAMDKSFQWFENNVIYRVPQNYPGAGRRVYPGFMQYSGFVAMNPDRHVTSHYDYFLDLVRGDEESAESHREFYDEYNAVLDMPAEYYLDTIKKVFQEFALVNGSWVSDGKPVRPQDIRHTALLTVEGELDDISGAGQTKAAHDLCSGIPAEHRFHYDAAGAGHYGIFSGRRWREMVYPRVRSFIADYDKGGMAPKAVANGAKAPARRTSKAAAAKPSAAAARRR